MEQAIKDAIEAGYRHFDTAHIYGNEAPIGRAILAKISEGAIKREDVFITTKLWCTYFEPALVIEACQRSNDALGLGYIDLYLLHNPVAMPLDKTKAPFPKNSDGTPATIDVDYLAPYKKLEECVDKGLVKSIGVSNFNSAQIKRVCDNARIKPVCNQVECSATINQRKLIEYCKLLGIVVTAYCPLGQHNKEKQTPKFMYDEKVQTIAKKYGKTPAQIGLRYIVSILTQYFLIDAIFDPHFMIIGRARCGSVTEIVKQGPYQGEHQRIRFQVDTGGDQIHGHLQHW